jgi:hypothetical protein
MTEITEAFCIRGLDGQPEYHAMVDGVLIPAEFNSLGAAQAAIPVERARRAKRAAKAPIEGASG